LEQELARIMAVWELAAIEVGVLLSLAFQCLAQLALKSIALAAAAIAPPDADPATQTKQAEPTTAENLAGFLATFYPKFYPPPPVCCEQFLTESKAFSSKVGAPKAKKKLIHSYDTRQQIERI
jgi:hypothetical protein